jgi:hypothetical protein
MWRFLPTDVVEQFDAPDSGFRVHFTRAGKNAVPLADANTNAVPDLVESVGSVYDLVLAKYQGQMGYRAPPSDLAIASNGGSERFDIYLLDFAQGADGAFRQDQCSGGKCIGYVVQENDFVGFPYPSATVATRILGSHEFFHAVQSAYDDRQDIVLVEGTAVWATEQFDPSTDDFESFLDGFMSRPDRSLDSAPAGPVPAYAYGSAVFFEFLSEKYGPAIIRKIWEHCELGKGDPSEPGDIATPHWLIQLDALLKAEYSSSFAEAYRTFVLWNFYTGPSANPAKSYANGAQYPQPGMTGVMAPQQLAVLRVYYASSQYFWMPAGNRASMGALLIDDPATAEDETQGMVLVLAARRNNVNSEVISNLQVKQGAPTVDTSANAQFFVAVVNTARAGVNGVLSKRPGLCIGSPDELRACRIALDPAFDAGMPDAGMPDAGPADAGPVDAGPADAGTSEDAGVDADAGMTAPPAPPGGCGCSTGGSAAAVWLVVGLMLRKRRWC